MAFSLNTPGVRPLADEQEDPNVTEEPDVPGRSPGALQRVPRSIYDRSSGPMTPVQINDQVRSRNADARQARITNTENVVQTRRDDLQSSTGHAVSPRQDIGSVRLDQQTHDLMAQTPATAAAHTEQVVKDDPALRPHDPYVLPGGRDARLDALRRRVAMDPDSQVGSGSQFDPTRPKTQQERMMDVARQLKPGDSIGVTNGGSTTTASSPVENGRQVPTASTVNVSPAPPARPGTVSEDGGKTWQPVKQATAALEAQNEQTARPARLAKVENDAYFGAIRSGQAKTFDQAQQIGTQAVKDYAPLDAPMGPPGTASNDPYRSKRKKIVSVPPSIQPAVAKVDPYRRARMA